mmetsp:Transcript_44098/g.42778  ORF Transcript_44098/g.42778 Transcript_44098/m.42778 type:complete len:138 (-) Transcript_44098:34-447(-)
MKVVGEAIKLMKNRNLDRAATDQYKGWVRVLPNPDLDGSYDFFMKAKFLYDRLVVKKGALMTINMFAKLGKVKGMTNANLQKANYEIIYKRTLSRTGKAQMTLEVFVEALEALADVLFPTEIEKLETLINHILSHLG